MIRKTIAMGTFGAVLVIAGHIGAQRAQPEAGVPGGAFSSSDALRTPSGQHGALFDGPPWLHGCPQEDEVRVTFVDGSSRCYAADDLGLGQ